VAVDQHGLSHASALPVAAHNIFGLSLRGLFRLESCSQETQQEQVVTIVITGGIKAIPQTLDGKKGDQVLDSGYSLSRTRRIADQAIAFLQYRSFRQRGVRRYINTTTSVTGSCSGIRSTFKSRRQLRDANSEQTVLTTQVSVSWKIVSVLVASLLWCGLSEVTRAQRSGDFVTAFGGERPAPKNRNPHVVYDLNPAERFFIHVPANYTADMEYGLIVFTDADEEIDKVPNDWAKILDQRKFPLCSSRKRRE
jgi:hypothetical protein